MTISQIEFIKNYAKLMSQVERFFFFDFGII